MLVSVVVPSYNSRDYVSRLVKTFECVQGIELLIGYDGHKGFGLGDGVYIKEFSFEKIGRWSVIKELIGSALGDYIVICDDDDFILPGQNSILLESIKVSNSAILMCRCNYLDKTRNPLSWIEYQNHTPWRWHLRNGYRHDHKFIIRRNLLLDVLDFHIEENIRIPSSLIFLKCYIAFPEISYINSYYSVKEYLSHGLSANLKSRKLSGGAYYREYLNLAFGSDSIALGYWGNFLVILRKLYSYRKFKL